MFRFIKRYFDREHTRMELERLSDRALKDIGLYRGDIDFVVKSGVFPTVNKKGELFGSPFSYTASFNSVKPPM